MTNWIDQKTYDKYLAEYDEYCSTLDIECPDLAIFLMLRSENKLEQAQELAWIAGSLINQTEHFYKD